MREKLPSQQTGVMTVLSREVQDHAAAADSASAAAAAAAALGGAGAGAGAGAKDQLGGGGGGSGSRDPGLDPIYDTDDPVPSMSEVLSSAHKPTCSVELAGCSARCSHAASRVVSTCVAWLDALHAQASHGGGGGGDDGAASRVSGSLAVCRAEEAAARRSCGAAQASACVDPVMAGFPTTAAVAMLGGGDTVTAADADADAAASSSIDAASSASLAVADIPEDDVTSASASAVFVPAVASAAAAAVTAAAFVAVALAVVGGF